jgi:putative PIN family toxin of toxin-antitoxin system
VRAVFDTDIFVSAFVFPGGRAEEAVTKAAQGDAALVISKPVIRETLDVLARKFDRTPEELARVAVFLAEFGEVVTPRAKLRVLDDEPDNRILECAVAGRADVLVTGDRAMLDRGSYQGVRIVTRREFLKGKG